MSLIYGSIQHLILANISGPVRITGFPGSWFGVSGFWVLVFSVQVSGFRVSRFGVSRFGFSRFGVWGWGFRFVVFVVRGFRIGVSVSRTQLKVLRFAVWGVGVGVSCFGVSGSGSGFRL